MLRVSRFLFFFLCHNTNNEIASDSEIVTYTMYVPVSLVVSVPSESKAPCLFQVLVMEIIVLHFIDCSWFDLISIYYVCVGGNDKSDH